MNDSKIPVLLDTDIGSDIDDAVCLAYLLKQPRCELLGITTVSGNVQQRSALAAAVCDAGGRGEVPIHSGVPEPLLTGPGQRKVPHYEVFEGRDHRKDFAPGTAIEFLRTQIRARPGEITLLAIGPLTNVALLFRLDPEIPSLLKELVLMCGVFTSGAGHTPGAREWNALVDPIATAIVYGARPAKFTSIGLEVTMKCQMDAGDVRKRFTAAGGPLAPVADMAEVWFRHRPKLTFHDPLAAAVIFQPELCDYADGEVTVETESKTLFGLTDFKRATAEASASAPHRIATDVRSKDFFDHYFKIVGG
jgi:purine nucleosidase